MVRLKVWISIRCNKRSRTFAALADTHGAFQDVLLYSVTAFPGQGLPLNCITHFSRISDRKFSKFTQRLLWIVGRESRVPSVIIIRVSKFFNRYQLKHNGLPRSAVFCRCHSIVKTRTNELAYVANMCAMRLLKQMEVFSGLAVIQYRAITGHQPHIPTLSFAGIVEETIFLPAIFIAVWLPTFSGEQKDKRSSRWSTDASLLLTSIHLVQGAATIDMPRNEHQLTPTLSNFGFCETREYSTFT